MPDTYTSQFSGEEIDAALRAAQMISGASTPAELRDKLEIRGDTIPVSAEDSTLISEALTKIPTTSGGGVNPNLLDNSLFQVWQRYSDGSYTGVPANIYIADRWLILSSNGDKTNKLTKVSPYGIKNESGASLRIWQRLENAAQYNGMTLTLSILYGNGILYSATLLASDWTDKTDIFDLFAKKANSNRMSWLTVGDVWLAAKLELGDQQTLAHKENGVWVLNEIPDYGEQLRRCQMYHLGDMQRDAPGRISGDNTAYCVVPIPVTMRQSSATPVQAISKYGNIVDKDGAFHVVNNAYCVVEADSYLLFAVVSTETMPVGPCVWQDAHFSVSKDL